MGRTKVGNVCPAAIALKMKSPGHTKSKDLQHTPPFPLAICRHCGSAFLDPESEKRGRGIDDLHFDNMFRF